MTHPVVEHLKRFRVRWAIAAGVSVAALALTAFAVAGRGAPLGRANGPGLNIAVVAPVEPDVQPGDIMDVGHLNNSFDGRMPEPVEQVSTEDDLNAEQPAYVDGDQGWRAEKGADGDYDAPPEKPVDRVEREAYRERPMAFGFDRPPPDWRAEREARRAAPDAEARERTVRRERRYTSSGDRPQDGDGY